MVRNGLHRWRVCKVGAYAGVTNSWINISSSNSLTGLVKDGLVLALDAGRTLSYPGSGTTWTDLTNNGRNGTLTNGPTYSSGNGGTLTFDGIDDYVSSVSNLTLANNFSVSLWLRHTNSYPVQEKYISLGSDRIVIQSNENGNLSSYVTDSTQQNLLVWGWNNGGDAGTNDGGTVKNTPVTTFAGGTTWKQVSAGYPYMAAIKTDGTLWMWGSNANGKLGTNNETTRSTPVTTFAGGNNWKQVSANGRFHTAAIKTDGTLWTWGSSERGQVGNNQGIFTASRLTPVTTFAGGTNWKFVNCGERHTAAIKTDGSLWVWGVNERGELGDNTTISRSTPITTFAGGNDWKSVSAGYHTAAIKTDGSLWIWGRNAYVQLGTNDTAGRTTPVTTFAGGNNWKQVSCGRVHTAAIKTDGSLWLWGQGDNGRLGTNDTTRRSTPVTTFSGGTNWKQVACGESQTMAVKTDGTLWGWGQGNVGRLGTNGNNSITPTTTFAGGNNWKQVSSGGTNGAAIKTNGTFINDDDSNISLLNTKYYNISLTCNGTTIKIHLDSVEILSSTISGTLTSTDVSFTISSLLDCFKGNISQVSVYNRALTAGEIQQNFNATRSRYSV